GSILPSAPDAVSPANTPININRCHMVTPPSSTLTAISEPLAWLRSWPIISRGDEAASDIRWSPADRPGGHRDPVRGWVVGPAPRLILPHQARSRVHGPFRGRSHRQHCHGARARREFGDGGADAA